MTEEAIRLLTKSVPPEKWDERMGRDEIARNRHRMLIYAGKRTKQLDPSAT